jgi:hypothetical protein
VGFSPYRLKKLRASVYSTPEIRTVPRAATAGVGRTGMRAGAEAAPLSRTAAKPAAVATPRKRAMRRGIAKNQAIA